MMWAALVVLFACSTETEMNGADDPSAQMDVDPVQKAGVIAAKIDADPSGADAVLAEHGLTEAAYRSLLEEIAKDPAKTDAFLKAKSGG